MRRALIIDDEEAVLKIITHFIEMKDMPIKIVGKATSGDEAVDKIIGLEPDIVFIDIQMPIYNGLEVIEKTSHLSKKINFVVITAFNYFEYAQKALRLNVKDILLKPLDMKEFTKSVEKIIGYQYTNNDLLNEILEYINLNYSNDLKLNDCARLFLTNPSNISRIEKSIELLENTTKSINEIAEIVGYNSLNNFYKNFKIEKGMTPKVYKLNTKN